MRRALVFLMVAVFFPDLAPPSPGASRDLPALFPIKQQGKWGFIDRTGKVIVSPQFKNAWDFSEGRAGVLVGDRFGFIDQTGKVVIQPQFDKVAEFSAGLAAVWIAGKWGFVDLGGKMVISPRFTSAGNFYEDRAWVKVDDKYGYLDKQGNLAISPRFETPGTSPRAWRRRGWAGKLGTSTRAANSCGRHETDHKTPSDWEKGTRSSRRQSTACGA